MLHRCFWGLICFGLWSSSLLGQQDSTLIVNTIKSKISELDSSLVKQDSFSLNILLSEQLSLGHSNAWVQKKQDIFKDFSSGKLKYNKIKQTSIEEITIGDNLVSVRRKIDVAGKYKNYDFEMKLSVLEIWIKSNRGEWQLWSRQSVKVE